MMRWLPLILCALCLLIGRPSAAQEFGYGGKLGMTIHTLTEADGEPAPRNKGGFVAGGFLDFAFGSTFSVQPQLLFVQKGAKTLEDGVDGTITLDYVEVPLLGVVTFPRAGPVIPFVYAGPAIAANVNATVEVDGVETDIPEEDIKSNDVSVVVGGGIYVDGFTLEARYTAGVSSIAQEADEPKSRGLYIMGGFSFPLR